MQSLVLQLIYSYYYTSYFSFARLASRCKSLSWSYLVSRKPRFCRLHLPVLVIYDFLLGLTGWKERKVVLLRFWQETHFSVARALLAGPQPLVNSGNIIFFPNSSGQSFGMSSNYCQFLNASYFPDGFFSLVHTSVYGTVTASLTSFWLSLLCNPLVSCQVTD